MSSSISRSRSLSRYGVIIAALALFAAIELLYYGIVRPNEFERTNFLQFRFVTPETPQRLFVYHKMQAFADARPRIVQAGDSSGFYGIRPREVMQHLPEGASYVNMSCCANLGFRGYYNILQFMLERNDTIRYIVFYFTAYTMPRPEMWDSDGAQLWADLSLKVFGNDVYHEYLSPWQLFRVPTLAARRVVSNRIFYQNGRFWPRSGNLSDNVNYLHFLRIYRDTLGWMPESDVRDPPVAASQCMVLLQDFWHWRTLGRRTYLRDVLDEYANLARRYRVTLVVAFQPTACIGTDPQTERARAEIAAFRRDNPDVEVPFDLAETWPSEQFSVPAHVTDEMSPAVSDRLGRALAEIIGRRGM